MATDEKAIAEKRKKKAEKRKASKARQRAKKREAIQKLADDKAADEELPDEQLPEESTAGESTDGESTDEESLTEECLTDEDLTDDELADMKVFREPEYDPDKPRVDNWMAFLTLQAGGGRRNSMGNVGSNRFPMVARDSLRTRRLNLLGGLEMNTAVLDKDLVERVYNALEEKFGKGGS